jgi:hypothetical protein
MVQQKFSQVSIVSRLPPYAPDEAHHWLRKLTAFNEACTRLLTDAGTDGDVAEAETMKKEAKGAAKFVRDLQMLIGIAEKGPHMLCTPSPGSRNSFSSGIQSTQPRTPIR